MNKFKFEECYYDEGLEVLYFSFRVNDDIDVFKVKFGRNFLSEISDGRYPRYDIKDFFGCVNKDVVERIYDWVVKEYGFGAVPDVREFMGSADELDLAVGRWVFYAIGGV